MNLAGDGREAGDGSADTDPSILTARIVFGSAKSPHCRESDDVDCACEATISCIGGSARCVRIWCREYVGCRRVASVSWSGWWCRSRRSRAAGDMESDRERDLEGARSWTWM